jgi:hypothetical protein
VLWPGIAGYSDLAVDKDGAICCLYETRMMRLSIPQKPLIVIISESLGSDKGAKRNG